MGQTRPNNLRQPFVPGRGRPAYPVLQYPEANKDLVRAYCDIVADCIEDEPDAFDQNNWGDTVTDSGNFYLEVSCGTPGCVAGHLLAYLGIRDEPLIPATAAVEWGLTLDQRECLFESSWPHCWFMDIPKDCPLPLVRVPGHTRSDGSWISDGVNPTAEDAAKIMRRLAEYGWDGATYEEAYKVRGW